MKATSKVAMINSDGTHEVVSPREMGNAERRKVNKMLARAEYLEAQSESAQALALREKASALLLAVAARKHPGGPEMATLEQQQQDAAERIINQAQALKAMNTEQRARVHQHGGRYVVSPTLEAMGDELMRNADAKALARFAKAWEPSQKLVIRASPKATGRCYFTTQHAASTAMAARNRKSTTCIAEEAALRAETAAYIKRTEDRKLRQQRIMLWWLTERAEYAEGAIFPNTIKTDPCVFGRNFFHSETAARIRAESRKTKEQFFEEVELREETRRYLKAQEFKVTNTMRRWLSERRDYDLLLAPLQTNGCQMGRLYFTTAHAAHTRTMAYLSKSAEQEAEEELLRAETAEYVAKCKAKVARTFAWWLEERAEYGPTLLCPLGKAGELMGRDFYTTDTAAKLRAMAARNKTRKAEQEEMALRAETADYVSRCETKLKSTLARWLQDRAEYGPAVSPSAHATGRSFFSTQAAARIRMAAAMNKTPEQEAEEDALRGETEAYLWRCEAKQHRQQRIYTWWLQERHDYHLIFEPLRVDCEVVGRDYFSTEHAAHVGYIAYITKTKEQKAEEEALREETREYLRECQAKVTRSMVRWLADRAEYGPTLLQPLGRGAVGRNYFSSQHALSTAATSGSLWSFTPKSNMQMFEEAQLARETAAYLNRIKTSSNALGRCYFSTEHARSTRLRAAATKSAEQEAEEAALRAETAEYLDKQARTMKRWLAERQDYDLSLFRELKPTFNATGRDFFATETAARIRMRAAETNKTKVEQEELAALRQETARYLRHQALVSGAMSIWLSERAEYSELLLRPITASAAAVGRSYFATEHSLRVAQACAKSKSNMQRFEEAQLARETAAYLKRVRANPVAYGRSYFSTAAAAHARAVAAAGKSSAAEEEEEKLRAETKAYINRVHTSSNAVGRNYFTTSHAAQTAAAASSRKSLADEAEEAALRAETIEYISKRPSLRPMWQTTTSSASSYVPLTTSEEEENGRVDKMERGMSNTSYPYSASCIVRAPLSITTSVSMGRPREAPRLRGRKNLQNRAPSPRKNAKADAKAVPSPPKGSPTSVALDFDDLDAHSVPAVLSATDVLPPGITI